MTQAGVRDDTLPHAVKCAACGALSPPNSVACAGCETPFRNVTRDAGTVLGSYRLLDVIGEGGMGVVYLAEHVRLGRRVAIKMLRGEYTDNRQAVHRFFSEARAVNKINHQNIVEITDFVEQPGGDNYYIMELLQGTSLANLIDTQGAPTLDRTIGIMTQVASALETVHAAGIVHRDLKPDNVFLIERSGQNDFVKLLDFGVAKLGQIAEVSTHTTAAGAILGTPEYMSPEQASGKVVDFRTDIYAFGVLLYEMATGKLPVTGSNFGELVVKHLTVEPTPPTQVAGVPHTIPPALEDVILACLAKDPADRPADMKAIADRLFEIADAEDWAITSFRTPLRTTGKLIPMQRPRSAPSVDEEPDPEPPKRKSRALPLAIALAVTATLAIAYVVLGRSSEPAETKPATVELVFESTPAGADVFRKGETVPLGKTPVTLTFPQSDRTESFELRLADHDPIAHSVRLDRSAGITSRLVKRAPPPPPPPPPDKVVHEPVDVVVPEVPDPRKPPPRDPKKPPRVVIKKIPEPTPDPKAGSGSAAPNPGDRSGVLDPFAPKKK